MTEIIQPTKRKGRGRLTFIIILLGLGAGIFFMVKGCVEDISPDQANLVVKKDGKVYLFSNFGSANVKNSIEKNESPYVIPFVRVYKDDGKYYLDPHNLEHVVNALAGDYELHLYKEKSVDGYATVGNVNSFELNVKNEGTAKIGEQLTVYDTKLTNKKGKEMHIRSNINQKTFDIEAIENCFMHSFWIQSTPSPRETVTSSREFLVVSLDDLVKFFGKSFAYDPEEKVLYVMD